MDIWYVFGRFSFEGQISSILFLQILPVVACTFCFRIVLSLFDLGLVIIGDIFSMSDIFFA